jgi:hypothetical protein
VHFNDDRWGVIGTYWFRGYPVFVEYDVSCLQALHVTYHKRQKTIEAWGAVLLENVLGKEERFDAVLLKFDHGKLASVKLLEGKERTGF